MKRICFLYLFLLTAFSSFSLELETINAGSNFYLIFNQTTDNAPYVFNTGLEGGITLGFSDLFAFEPTLGFYDIYYGLSSSDRPLPVDQAERRLTVVTLVIDPIFALRFNLFDKARLSLFASPSFFITFPLKTWWDDGNNQTGYVFSYLYSSLRFFQPMAGVAFSYGITESMLLEIRGKVYIPVFHIWDMEELQFQDQMKVSITLNFKFKL